MKNWLSEQFKKIDRDEEVLVRILGESIGYGRIMQLAEEIWKKKENGRGGEHTVGPCGAFMVPCPHPKNDDNGHCDICCGSGRITKGVAKLLK